MSTDRTEKNGVAISRRGFLGLCAGAGGAALGMRSFTALADVVPHSTVAWRKGQVIPSVCNMCVNRCGIQCRVVDGVLQKIEGDPRHPLSRGGTCAKGQAGVMALYDPDRIKYPMIRVGARGEGKWRRASWDEAYDYVADNLSKIIEKHGAKSLLFSSTTDLTEQLFIKFGTYMGTPNFARHATLCLASRQVGYFATLGGVPDADLTNSKYIVMFGANRLEAFELPYNIELIEAIEKGAKLVSIDPRLTVTASKGQWIAIRPHTDMALVLALMNVLISEQLYDKDFVANYSVGFEELKAHVAQYTPEWAAKETDVPAKTIITLAHEMAAAAPAVVIFPGRRTSWYTDDTQFRRTTAMLAGLLGGFDAKGALYMNGNSAKLGSFNWAMDPVDVSSRFDEFDKRFPLGNPDDGGYVHLRDTLLAGTGKYPMKGWMIYHQNPVAAVHDSNKTMEMIKKMDFICAIDIQPSQTAWMADIILPETSYLERLDPLWATSARQKFIAMRQPVVKPQHEAKTLLEMIKGIAPRLDKKHAFETPLTEAFNFTMDEFIDAQLKGAPVDRATLQRDGIWTEADIKYTIGDFRSGKKKFDTPSGKVEFVSERFARNGYPSLPSYVPPVEEAGKQRLVSGRHAWFTHTANQNNAWLHDLYPENELWINPDVARSKGIANGDYVRVKSEVGEARVKALVTTKIRKDTVFLCHGFGSDVAGQKLAYHKGASDQLLMKSHADVISNNQAMHETFVEVVKA